MARMKVNKDVNKNNNIEKLIENNEICKLICEIEYKDIENARENEADVIEKKIKDLSERCYDENAKNGLKSQIGKVWILLKYVNENKSYEVLQVAQALEYEWKKKKGYWEELRRYIRLIMSTCKDEERKNIYREHGEKLGKEDKLAFYEIDTDIYLSTFAPKNYKEIIYNMSKEYYVEASIAYFTQANWGYYNPGMDKRAYFYLLNNNKADEIDKQNVK